jgi:hypothetical protein
MTADDTDTPAVMPPGSTPNKTNRRVRFAPSTDPKLRGWLTRASRCHAHLCGVVRLYSNPKKAGGQSLLGEDFASRIAAGDRSLLYDALGYCRDEIDELREQISVVMDSAPPTRHPPGSPEKVDEMMRRLERGFSLFVPDDAPAPRVD